MCHDDHEQHNFFSSRFETQILQISVTKERKSVKDAYNNDKLSYRRSGQFYDVVTQRKTVKITQYIYIGVK